MADDSAHPLNYPLFRRSPLESSSSSSSPPPPPPLAQRRADGGESAAAHEDNDSEDSTSDDDDAVDTVRALGPRTEPLAAAPDSAARGPTGGAGARVVPAAHTRAAPADAYYSASPFAVEPASSPWRLVLPSHSVSDSSDDDGGAWWEAAGVRTTRAEAGDGVLPMRPALQPCPAEPDAVPVSAGSPAAGSARGRSLPIDDDDDDDRERDGDGGLAVDEVGDGREWGGGQVAVDDVGDGVVWGGGQEPGSAAGLPDAWRRCRGCVGRGSMCRRRWSRRGGRASGRSRRVPRESDEDGTSLDICV